MRRRSSSLFAESSVAAAAAAALLMPDMDVDEHFGDGLKQYYVTKIEELQLIVNEKTQNLRRLQAQRNELNAKGESGTPLHPVADAWVPSPSLARGVAAAAGAGVLRG